MASRVTSADVGRAAGVSRATVSYVLNNRMDARVTEATREHVLATARRLGYHGSPAARALRAGRGEIVMLLLPEWNTAGEIGRALREIGSQTTALGLACLRYEGPEWRQRVANLLGMVTAAAVVTFEPLTAEDQEAVASAGIPEIRAWFLDSPGGPHTTHIDQASVVLTQIDHLMDRGIRELAFVIAQEPHDQGFAEARLGAFQAICRDRGLRDDRILFVEDDLTELAEKLGSWHDEAGRLGVAAFSDFTAVGVLSAAAVVGLRVPDDAAVIGVDDVRIASLTRPPLTTVKLDLMSEAVAVAHRLATALELPAPDADSQRPPLSLVVRSTT